MNIPDPSIVREGRRRLALALTTTFSAHAVVAAASIVVPVLTPQLAVLYGIEIELVGLYSSMVYVASFIATLVTASVIGRLGPVTVLNATMIATALGLLALLGGNAVALLVSAILVGAAFGPANPTSSTLLSHASPPQFRGRIFAIKQTSVPVGIFAVGLFAPHVYEKAGIGGVISIVLVFCIATLVYSIVIGRKISPPLVRRERRSRWRTAIEPLYMVSTRPALRTIVLVALGFTTVQYTFAAVITLVLVEHAAFSAAAAGGVLSMVMIGSIIARVIVGWSADAFSARSVILALAAFLLIFALAYPFGLGVLPPILLIGLTVLFGSFCFSWNGVVLSKLADYVPVHDLAMATAGTMAISFVGGIVGPAVFTVFLTVTGSVVPGFLFLSASAALGIAMAFRMKKAS